MTNVINIEVIAYPGALQSAVYGIKEFFELSNAQGDANQGNQFAVTISRLDALALLQSDIIIVPPNMDGDFYLRPQPSLNDYLLAAHQRGAVLCSACAGSFILGHTGLLSGREITTHWQLAEDFRKHFPDVQVDIDKIVVDGRDIISAGGIMSWMDLVFTIVKKYRTARQAIRLGKYLVMDTGFREQRYYQSFVPSYTHGNAKVLKAQRFIDDHYASSLSVGQLAEWVNVTPRTLMRYFDKVLSLTPTGYIQRVRIQRACELLEDVNHTIDRIGYLVGYEDVNSFRKIFNRVMGLSPSEFRRKFLNEATETVQHDALSDQNPS